MTLAAPLSHQDVGRLLSIAGNKSLTITSAGILWAAERRGIPCVALDQPGLFLLGEGQHKQLINGTITSRTPRSAAILASDKR
jgi:hypothetical protein